MSIMLKSYIFTIRLPPGSDDRKNNSILFLKLYDLPPAFDALIAICDLICSKSRLIMATEQSLPTVLAGI